MATNRKAAAIKAKARKDTPAANGDKIANGTEIANSESRLFCAGASARSAHSACISKPATETKIQKIAPPASNAPMATAIKARRSEEHTSELQPLMRISYAVFCLKKKNKTNSKHN